MSTLTFNECSMVVGRIDDETDVTARKISEKYCLPESISNDKHNISEGYIKKRRE